MLVIDSNVFVSALGKPDDFTIDSKRFFKGLDSETELVLPSLVVWETVTAIFKQNIIALKVVVKYFQGLDVIPLDTQYINLAVSYLPKDTILKSSDLIVALTAKIKEATLITWDNQLLRNTSKFCTTLTPKQYFMKKTPVLNEKTH